MPTTLWNVLRFTGLVVGVPTNLPHGLNIYGRGVPPHDIIANGGGYTITADDTNVTVTRTGAAAADVDVEVIRWHTIQDCEPQPGGIASSLLPFVFQGVGSGGGGIAVAAGTQTGATGTVVMSDSNGVAFGMSNSSVITASVTAVKSLVAANGTTSTTATGPAVVFSNFGGVTFGISGNTITASVQTVGGTATGVGISAGTETAGTGVVVFSNDNNVTFGMTASTVTASFYQPSVQKVVGFTATGGETDFNVTMAAVANTNYAVVPSNAGVSLIPAYDCPKTNRSLTAFRVIPTGALASGDVLEFLVFAS